MDASMGDTFQPTEVLRSIKAGLLYVQYGVDAWPSMSSVVVMLSSDVPLSQLKEPGFFNDWNPQGIAYHFQAPKPLHY